MNLKDQLRKREKAVVWHLLTELLAAECGEGFIQLDRQRYMYLLQVSSGLKSCVTIALTRRALCDISFGHLIIV
jgi:hypothetical protein